MLILLKNATIIYPGSKLHKAKKDILVKNGVIEKISNRISDSKAKLIESENLHISPGWLDVGAMGGEPGYEHRETFETLSLSAASGGYTGLAIFPNTNPVIDNKSALQFIVNNSESELVDYFPIGAISKDCKGEEITEMIDMHKHGAIAFSDGRKSIISNGLLLRALQYVKSFEGLIIHHPDDPGLSNGNDIHEGTISTQLGLKASPNLAEILTLERDVLMTEYAESNLLVHNISTKESVEKLEKIANENIFSSVSYLNLCSTDEDLFEFDVNYKANPPLRASEDRLELIRGVSGGIIDIICSNHVPLEEELKKMEFVYAELGATGLQTCFSAIKTFAKKIRLDQLINCLSTNPRRILGLDEINIKEGEVANLTIFDPKSSWVYNESNNYSKSTNSPFLNQAFDAKVLGIINGKKSHFNIY